ncbi:MAG: rhomboid family intramembrane serine protease [Bacteroidota bacterium]
MNGNQFKPSSGFKLLPPVVKNLLIINGLFFLASFLLTVIGKDLVSTLGLYYLKSDLFKPYQIISHMFMHGRVMQGGLLHILFNMYALWMFGKVLEQFWGAKRFFIYYIVTGLGAAILHQVVQHIQAETIITQLVDIGLSSKEINELALSGKYNTGILNYISKDRIYNLYSIFNGPVVGASGAVFGLLLAFGMIFPNAELMLLFLPVPIKAKYFVIMYGVAELYFGFSNNPNDNVAHFAHLGGMLFGIILILMWKKNKGNKWLS